MVFRLTQKLRTVGLIALGGVAILALTCTPPPSGPGSSGTGGSGVSTPGTGGSATPGTGGTTFGSGGGFTPGSGGSAQGSGGTTTVGSGGSTPGTGGAPGTGGTPPTYVFPTCTPTPATAAIADFTYIPSDAGTPSTGSFSWGDYMTTFSGYSFVFPSSVVADVTTGVWHVTGMVTDYAAFVLAFNCKTDASAFTGVQFTIKGNAGPMNQVTLALATPSNEVGSTDAANPSWGSCVPAANQYDGTCAAPSKVIPVTADAVTVTLKWADIAGGKPSATVNPAELFRMVWSFPWAGAASVPYPIDITVDDVVFTTN